MGYGHPGEHTNGKITVMETDYYVGKRKQGVTNFGGNVRFLIGKLTGGCISFLR